MKRKLSQEQIRQFRSMLYSHYKKTGRVFPWRPPALKVRKDGTVDPYKILISEIMLQQTQVDRVIKKYSDFLKKFPNIKTLAAAPLSQVLKEWQGMGYNRRALNMRKTAEAVVRDHGGHVPNTIGELEALPGIGHATASAVCAFAYNQPSVFIETNIRSVYIHHFFSKKNTVHDQELTPLIEQTLNKRNPRKFYSALMDYGSFIKKRHSNPNRKSRHYVRQSNFDGSNRQLRGLILRILSAHDSATVESLASRLGRAKKNFEQALQQLENEGIITRKLKRYSISD